MKIKKPLVSVIMPVYNASLYLREAIDSVLSQTFKDYELIIINDGSTDNSGEIINDYKKNNPSRIIVLRNKVALGCAGEAATNQAIKIARGKYIAKMDADDVSDKNRLKKEVEYLEKHENIFLIGSQAKIIDGHNNIIGVRNVPLSHNNIWKEFYLRSCVIHPSVMFRRESIREDFYNLKFKHFNDYYTFFNLMSCGKKFANLPDYLVKYRIHGMNTTYSNLKLKFEINYKIKQSFLNKNYKPPLFHKLIVFFQRLVVILFPEKFIIFMFIKLNKNK